MQVPEPDRETFDRCVRCALGVGGRNVQPPEQVWQRIVDRVTNSCRVALTPKPPCQQRVSVGSKS